MKGALAFAVAFEALLVPFGVGLTAEAGAGAIGWAVGGGVAGALTGLLMVRQMIASLRGGETRRGRTEVAAVAGAFVGIAVARVLGENARVALVWFAVLSIGVAVTGAAVAMRRMS